MKDNDAKLNCAYAITSDEFFSLRYQAHFRFPSIGEIVPTIITGNVYF